MARRLIPNSGLLHNQRDNKYLTQFGNAIAVISCNIYKLEVKYSAPESREYIVRKSASPHLAKAFKLD